MEDEDPTPASSSPPPINKDASPVASPLVGSDPASFSPPPINEDPSPVASPLVGSDPASSSPPPINEDASPVASRLVGSDPASSYPPPINEDASPVASPLVRSDNLDTDDDGDDVDGEEKDEEKPWKAELHDRDLRRLHHPSLVTIIKTPEASVAVGVPISKPSPAAASSGREDCWSEGATWALIEAWGERHLRSQAEPQGHQRGGLRQKDWEDVADAVSSRGGGGKQAKSEGQCKNRIDTLKKKYKVERIKPHSSWSYFRRLNDLLAADYEDGAAGSGNALDCKPPVGVGFGSFRHQLQQLQMKKKKRTTKKRSHRQLLQSVRALPFLSTTAPRHGKEAYSDGGLPPINGKKRKMTGRDDLLLGGPISARPLVRKGGNGPEVGLRELARAVMRLGEVYERIEKSILRQEEELEKRRMGLAKELEVQRMNLFMKTLLELKQHNQKKPKRLATPNATENPVAPAINTSNDSNKSAVSGEE